MQHKHININDCVYSGRLEHPPPHDMVSFQNLMDSMGLPYTPGSEDGTATEGTF